MNSFMKNRGIATKIVVLLLLLGSITLLVAVKGSRNLLKTTETFSDLTGARDPATTLSAQVHQRITGIIYNSYKAMSYDGNSAEAREAGKQVQEDYKQAMKQLDLATRLDPGNTLIYQMRDYLYDVYALSSRAVRFGLANRKDEAKALLVQVDRLDRRQSPLVRDRIDKIRVAVNEKSDELGTEAAETSAMLYVIAVASVLAGITVALAVTRFGITAPLARLRTQMGEIAGGDYGRDVEGGDRRDEVGQMAAAVMVFRENGIAKQAADEAKKRAEADQKMVVDTLATHLSEMSAGNLTAAIRNDFPGHYAELKINFNDALEKLRELIASVAESSATIRTGSGEIAQASEDLARRTESNAASLEETAAAIAQMDGRLKASAEAATRTVGCADQAITTVGKGRAVADEAVGLMGRVSESAKGIDAVIEGLDKIAFQTRVLAMNAAVEAGRAGDAGRGFAVVADLVSALAMRAEEEAKRARDQLTVTQTDIVTAVGAVTKVDGALAAISGDVSQVHQLLEAMAADNQAQSAAVTQISAAIGMMDRTTQQNAAMVEETSAAARNLAGEVTGLTEQASRFKVVDRDNVRPMPGRPIAKPRAVLAYAGEH